MMTHALALEGAVPNIPVVPARSAPAGALLALDLGTATGWALRSHEGLTTSGTVSFRPSRYDGGGMRYLRFTNWLTELDQLSGPIAAIWYEEVRRHVGTDAAHVYGGLMATLTAWAELRGVPYQGVPVGTIKRHATGHGNAGKDLRAPAQGVLGLDTDDPRPQPDRARVGGVRPAALLRRLPALCPRPVAQVRAAALGEGPARDRGLCLRGLRRGDRRASQDGDARGGRVAGDRDLCRPLDDRLPPLGALFAGRGRTPEAPRCRSPGSRSTPATTRPRSIPGRGGT